MTRELLFFLTPLAALLAATVFQVVDYRLRRSLSGSYLAALAGGLMGLGVLSWILRGPDAAEDLALGLANLGTFLGLWLCFVAVVGLGVSLRVRIMSFLKHSGHPQSEADIEATFEGGQLVARRIERLVAGGHVRREGDRYVSGGTWLTGVARFNASVKRFLTGQVSEFREN